MNKARFVSRALTGGMLIVALGGCISTTPIADKSMVATSGESGISAYLDTIQRLANSERAQQADVFYQVEREYTGAPTTAATLRYASALVTPGHPASNLAEGKKLLEQLLATPERLTPAERNLAAFLVKDADTRLQSQAEIRRLGATVDDRTRALANSERRALSQLEEILKLRRALEESQRKLDAIKSIERSIIERSATPSSSREIPREPSARE
jgi:hypothetical protein